MAPTRIASTALAATLLLAAGAASAQPTITGLQKGEIARSGRIAITGSGFGAGEGEVLVGGEPAWTTTWTDGRIVAYVPEASPLGPTALSVVAGGVPSNVVSFEVVDRVSKGRIRWTFESDGDDQWVRPALAPDGTVYLHTNNDWDGLVYALTPDGALEWVRKVNWYPYVPPTAGPDGAVYVGSIGTVYRISPEGAIDWEYNPPDGVNIEVAPRIGPDGLLYGAFEISGAFAVEPLTGEVVWENPGDPVMSSKSGDAVETVFGRPGPGQPEDRFYVSMDGGAGFYAFSLDGEQLFTASFGNLKGNTEVAVGSDGVIYGPRSIGLVVAAAEPTWGGTIWEYFPGWAVGTDHVAIGPDDTLYFPSNGGSRIEALHPDGSRKWESAATYSYRRPAATPDGRLVITHGTDGQYEPDFVRALDPATGDVLWSVLLLPKYDDRFRLMGVHHARITPDSTTAYLSTLSLVWGVPDDDPRALLYAIDLGADPPGIPCGAVTRFGARCTAAGRLQFGALVSGDHEGEPVAFDLDGQLYEVPVSGGRALVDLPGQGGTGARTVTLVDPAGCFEPVTATCP